MYPRGSPPLDKQVPQTPTWAGADHHHHGSSPSSSCNSHASLREERRSPRPPFPPPSSTNTSLPHCRHHCSPTKSQVVPHEELRDEPLKNCCSQPRRQQQQQQQQPQQHQHQRAPPSPRKGLEIMGNVVTKELDKILLFPCTMGCSPLSSIVINPNTNANGNNDGLQGTRTRSHNSTTTHASSHHQQQHRQHVHQDHIDDDDMSEENDQLSELPHIVPKGVSFNSSCYDEESSASGFLGAGMYRHDYDYHDDDDEEEYSPEKDNSPPPPPPTEAAVVSPPPPDSITPSITTEATSRLKLNAKAVSLADDDDTVSAVQSWANNNDTESTRRTVFSAGSSSTRVYDDGGLEDRYIPLPTEVVYKPKKKKRDKRRMMTKNRNDKGDGDSGRSSSSSPPSLAAFILNDEENSVHMVSPSESAPRQRKGTASRGESRRRQNRSVRFAYPPVTSLRQRPRLSSEEVAKSFWTEEELDEIEADRKQWRPENDVEIVATTVRPPTTIFTSSSEEEKDRKTSSQDRASIDAHKGGTPEDDPKCRNGSSNLCISVTFDRQRSPIRRGSVEIDPASLTEI